MTRMICAVALGGVVVLSAGVGAQADPQVGTWKLNLDKSKYTAGAAPKSSTTVVTAAGQGIKIATTTVLADGTTRHVSYTANYDGKSAAVTGHPDYDTVAITHSGNTMNGTRTKRGKSVQTFTTVVSADGKTRTVTTTGVDARGGKVENVQVYDKQ